MKASLKWNDISRNISSNGRFADLFPENCLTICIVLLFFSFSAVSCANHQEITERATEKLRQAVGTVATESLKLQGIDGPLAPWECQKHPDQINVWCWDESKQRFIEQTIEEESNDNPMEAQPTTDKPETKK